MAYHVPALLDETINGLNILPEGIYVDLTFGGGGHSYEILKRLKKGKLIAFDQDSDAAANKINDPRFIFLNQNFRFLNNNLSYLGVESADGILADLGVSFHQFDEAGRGFTFRSDAPLDMRMNRDNKIKASDILAKNDETELAAIFYNFGELRESRKIARLIVQARKSGLIETVSDLRSAIDKLAPPVDENRFYARVFQALRIAVNHELDYLKEMLEQVPGLLKPGGRLAIITYHSLEDRLVKDFMKTGNIHGREEKDFYGNRQTIFRLITRKAIVPCEDEIIRNPRSRSAKLRIAEKI